MAGLVARRPTILQRIAVHIMCKEISSVAPLAILEDKLVNVAHVTTVFEPTAGRLFTLRSAFKLPHLEIAAIRKNLKGC